jgi:Arginine repressor, DNA binding domain
MAESLDLFNEVRQLRSRVEELGGLTEAMLRTQAKEMTQDLVFRLGDDLPLKATFLAVDGQRSQGEILEVLKKTNIRGASQATVSRKIDVLEKEMHLIELSTRTAKGKIYKRAKLDEILGISRRLET